MNLGDTIIATATPPGEGAIALIRISGPEALKSTAALFKSKTKRSLQSGAAQQVYFGTLVANEEIIDEVLVTIFKAPHSYTGEDVIEISCHGSPFIQQQILLAYRKYNIRVAEPGEFTLRAYLNKKMDLSQAEAVADLIAADAAGAHRMALQQMRGGVSSHLNNLREKLIHFTALIELELDFSEEDVAFADRKELIALVSQIQEELKELLSSFALGNAIKTGVPVAIAGKPNAGKSSLLNALLNEEKAIVSNIPGTTRDSIEDTLIIEGIKFRFIDTAGLRDTSDEIEAYGVQRAFEKVTHAQFLLYLYDPEETPPEAIFEDLQKMYRKDLQFFLIENKIDRYTNNHFKAHETELKRCIPPLWNPTFLKLSTFQKDTLKNLKKQLHQSSQKGFNSQGVVISNARHYEALHKAAEALQTVAEGLKEQRSGDLLSVDLKEAIQHIGSISGTIDIDQDILGTIFGRFCIGK